MSVSKYYLILPIIGVILLFANCSDSKESNKREVEFIIYSKKINSYNNLYASVYTSDTNWVEIAKYADSLVQGHGFFSKVSFYPDSTNVPIMGKYYEYIANANAKPIAAYKVPSANRIFEERKEIDQTEDLTFNLYYSNNEVYKLKQPYSADYEDVNKYIAFHNNYEQYKQQTTNTASKFVNSMLKSKMDTIPYLFDGDMDKNEVKKIHEVLTETEWDKMSKSKGITSKKYNLWYVNYNFIKDFDTLKVKVHFDVNKSAEKIENIEYSLR